MCVFGFLPPFLATARQQQTPECSLHTRPCAFNPTRGPVFTSVLRLNLAQGSGVDSGVRDFAKWGKDVTSGLLEVMLIGGCGHCWPLGPWQPWALTVLVWHSCSVPGTRQGARGLFFRMALDLASLQEMLPSWAVRPRPRSPAGEADRVGAAFGQLCALPGGPSGLPCSSVLPTPGGALCPS